MLKLRKQIIALLLAAGLILTLTGCGAQETKTLRVGTMPITDNLPLWLAQEKGYFEEQGLEVELIYLPSAMERDSAFAAGQIDVAIGDLLGVVTMNSAGNDVKAVAVGQGITPGENRFAVLSSPNSGITKPEQLKNVPVALGFNTITHYMADRLLQDQGLTDAEREFNSMPKLPIRFEALMGDQVAAVILPDPLATLAEIQGAHVVVDNRENTVAQTVFVVRGQVLEQNLDGLRQLMQVYSRAVEDLQDDPYQYRGLLAEKAQVPEEVLADQQGRLKLHFSPTQLPDPQGLADTVAWMQAHGLLTGDMGYDDLVDRRVLEE